jgi:large subunit ribosomal protein L3
MQYWPRKRASRIYPHLALKKSAGILPSGLYAFAGYKVGMTHVLVVDTRKHSTTKGEEITLPVTVLECPPLKIIGVRIYKQESYGIMPAKEIIFATDKHLARVLPTRKVTTAATPAILSSFAPQDFASISMIVATQPHLAGIGKKTPEIFEIPLGGTIDEKKAFLEQHIGKDLTIQGSFKDGDYMDIHAVSKGKGFQGPVRRFGVSLRSHKSEKTTRGPGSLGPWSGQQHIMYRVAHAGQMGFHQRTEYNKQILKISSTPDEINVKGGFLQYGNVKSSYIILKGSITGARKRLIILSKPVRLTPAHPLPTITHISLESKQ